MTDRREVCKGCGRVNPLGFSVPDEVWSEAIPDRYLHRCLCILCFDLYATLAGVDWTATPIQWWPVAGVNAHET